MDLVGINVHVVWCNISGNAVLSVELVLIFKLEWSKKGYGRF